MMLLATFISISRFGRTGYTSGSATSRISPAIFALAPGLDASAWGLEHI